jgi:lipoic acid synthetase
MQDLEISDWGVLEYDEAYLRQKAWVDERISGRASDRLVLVEHPPVVTIGRSGSTEDLRVPEEALHLEGIAFHRVDRGGMATFHGPGQLVAYPILKLEERDLHRYVRTLQEIIAAVLRVYGLAPKFREGTPGVWVGSAKICSIGIAVRGWVAYHGMALNVNTDTRWFDWIVPCGHPGEKITSMERELGHPVDMGGVKGHFIEAFRRLFGYGRPREIPLGSSGRPPWLIRPAPGTGAIRRMEEKLRSWGLATVCESAQCPNLGECFADGTATFMILGTRCTRRCRFCAVDKGVPQPVDEREPEHVARMAQSLGLKYVVITSVTRDDLPDGGAHQFKQTIEEIRRHCPEARVEVLIPDFRGSLRALQAVFEARPDVLNHNIETVASLYPFLRPLAHYRRSLNLLDYAAKQGGLRTKSGLMLGLGETEQEVTGTLLDLKRTGCRYVTIGQYLAPSKDHARLARYVKPEEFERWADVARNMGFSIVAAGSLVRSSYRAHEMLAEEKRGTRGFGKRLGAAPLRLSSISLPEERRG